MFPINLKYFTGRTLIMQSSFTLYFKLLLDLQIVVHIVVSVIVLYTRGHRPVVSLQKMTKGKCWKCERGRIFSVQGGYRNEQLHLIPEPTCTCTGTYTY